MTWDFETFFTYLFDSRIAWAALVTFGVAAVAQLLATVIGFLLALGLRSRSRLLRAPAVAYVWFFRGTPPLIQLLLLYFGLPQLGIRITVLEAGISSLSLYGAAYMAEIIRGALASLDPGQEEAARSIGLSRFDAMRSILAPQAARLILPAFGNEFTSMMRTTSLLSVISFQELLRVTTLAISETFRPFELYSVAAVYYLLMATLWMIVQDRLERKFGVSTANTPVRRPIWSDVTHFVRYPRLFSRKITT
jgi:polar amino acid transport system permease protein